MPIRVKDPKSTRQVRSVAIIGGGASGAVALDSLLKERHFERIVVFERRDILGGIWCLDQLESLSGYVKIGDNVDPPLENPFRDGTRGPVKLPRNSQDRYVETPSYPSLKTNITESLMTFSDANTWTENTSPETEFVDGLVVRDYIERYVGRNSNENTVEISLLSSVEEIERVFDGDGSNYHFKLSIRQQEGNFDKWYQDNFDAIVVATGHYHVPYIPPVPGLALVQEKFPRLVQHAKYFRSAQPYKDKKVVVVGSRASGMDLVRLLAPTAGKLYHSRRNQLSPVQGDVAAKGVIKDFEIVQNEVVVTFDDGSTVTAPDHVIYGTGYHFSYPFLERLFGAENQPVTENGIYVPGLYQHTFWMKDPYVTFVGIPIDGVSFRVFEYQAVLVSRFLAGRVNLPSLEEQQSWSKRRLLEKGETRAYHTIGAESALDYMAELSRLGRVEDSAIVGRPFPNFTEDDLETYLSGRERLKKFWDES